MKLCGTSCVDISNTATDCGSCGHDCGGGTCSMGICQPKTLYTSALPITALGVSATEVYFSTDDTTNSVAKLLACPSSGCVLAPRQLVSMMYSINSVAWLPNGANNGLVVFESAPTQSTTRPALYPCPDTGCVGTPTSVASDGLGGFDGKLITVGTQVFYSSSNLGLNAITCNSGTCTNGTALGVGKGRPFTADGVNEYFIDSAATTGHSGYILGCALSATRPCTPSTVLATDVSSATDIQLVGTTLYWMIPGRSGYNEGRIRQCTLPACSTQTTLVGTLNSPTEMLVDGNGAYIINAANAIQRCLGSTCTGGIQDWATGTAPHHLRSDANFVYWADGTVLRRIAK